MDTELSDRHVRDEVMTLLFAGHDTTTATISFLFWELAERPDWDDLDSALDETLRLYPPAWIGPRRSVSAFELHGRKIPAGVPVNYCSWASHRLPDVWQDPHSFRPERFLPGEREKIPRGAYVPFGGGSRICLGMRFGQLEIRHHRRRHPRAFHARATARSQARDPPDADARPPRRAADAGPYAPSISPWLAAHGALQ